MKLAVVIDEGGMAMVVVAATGEMIEGQRFVQVQSGVDREKIIYLECVAFNEKGETAIG